MTRLQLLRPGVLRALMFAAMLAVAAFLGAAPASAQTTTFTYTNTTDATFGGSAGTADDCIDRNFTVPVNGVVTDINVGAIITHTNRAQVTLTLQSPAGTTITLMSNNGGAADNINILFDQAAANAISAYVNGTGNDTATATTAPPYQRTYRPTGSLNGFNGQDADGTWTLRMCDTVQADQGTFRHSTLGVTVATADLSVLKGITAVSGATITYTVALTATANSATSTNVTVRDILPTGVNFVSSNGTGTYNNATGIWTIPSIAAGQTVLLNIVATVTPAAGSTVTNIAQVWTAPNYDPDSTPGNNIASEDDYFAYSFNVPNADLSLTKSVSNPAPLTGSQVTYTLNLANAGPDDVTGVLVRDILPAGVTFVSAGGDGAYNSGTGMWNVSVDSGDTATLTIVVQVTATSGTVTNIAQVWEGPPDPDSTAGNSVPAEDDYDTAAFTVGADLSLTKTVNNPAPTTGSNVTYTVTLASAAGSATVANVTVRDILPAGVTFVSATPSTGTYVSGTGIWTIPTTAAGNTRTLTIVATVTATPGTTVNNIAQVWTSPAPDPDSTPGNSVGAEDDQANASFTVPFADLSLTKSVNAATRTVGQTVTYTITLTSAAGSSTAANVTVRDILPTGVTFASASATSGSYVSGTGIWTIPSIAAGGSAVLTLNGTVTAAALTGVAVVNSAEVWTSPFADPDSTPGNSIAAEDDQDSADFIVPADLSLTKTVSNSAPTSGSGITYTLNLTNAANRPALANVTVRDILPAGVDYVSFGGYGTYDPGTGIWTVPAIAANQTRTLTITVEVTATAGATVANVAEVWTSPVVDADSTAGNGATGEDDYATVSFTVGGARVAGTPPALFCAGGTTLHDWDSVAWTNGQTNNTYAVPNIGNVNFALTNPGAWLNLAQIGGQQPVRSNTITGGLTPVQFSLNQGVNMANRTQVVTTTITLPSAVSGAQFRVFDVDFGADTFADRIRVIGRLNGVNVTPTLTNGVSNYVIGNEAFGDTTAVDTTAGGNLVVTFNSAIDTIIIEYGNHSLAPADPVQQAIALHDITFCNPLATLNVSKTSLVYNDGSNALYNIPGNDVIYTITVSNTGPGTVTGNSLLVVDSMPTTIAFFNGDADGAGPGANAVNFVNNGAGVTWNFATDVRYSNAVAKPTTFAACTYTPATGYDAAVRHLCLNPKGVMNGQTGPTPPSFVLTFRARIQ